MSDERKRLDFQFWALIGATVLVGLTLTAVWLTTPPMMPLDFVKANWPLYVGLLLGILAAMWAAWRLRGLKDE